MITKLERLSNEIFFEIFEYLDIENLIQNFWDLNSRFNNLLKSLNNLPLTIKINNKQWIHLIAFHIGYLKINIWDDINLSQFSNLQSLTLSRATQNQLNQIRADIMPKLVYLSPCNASYCFAPGQLIYEIFTNKFPQLRQAKLGFIGACDPRFWTQSLSLRSLHVIYYNASVIPFILAACPNLRVLQVDISQDGDKSNAPIPTIDNHPLQRLVLRDFCRLLSYKDINILLNYIPNVEEFELKFDCQIEFIHLAENFTKYLPHLHRFDCHITEGSIDSSSDINQIRKLHPCFFRIQCRVPNGKFRVFLTE